MNLKKNSFIAKLFSKKPRSPKLVATIHDARELDLWPNDFHSHALDVVEILQQHKYEAYIVGGGVRDQLLNLHPKDFDVATNASPEQVKKCFQRCLIIGKRFRLAHVYFGRYDFVEVATFRKDHSFATHHSEASTRKGGIISRDNVYGSIEDDVVRRDFSVNALYYNPTTHEILDFCDGLPDLKARIIRLIGKPEERFREDPVRILRALRIGNKIACTIEPATLKAIPKFVPLLASISGGRLFDEYQKILLHGQAEKNFNSLLEFKILPILFPRLPEALKDKDAAQMILSALRNTDERYYAKKTINPAFLISVFLWHNLPRGGRGAAEAMTAVLKEQARVTNIPRYQGEVIEDIWHLQRHLEHHRKKKILDTLQHPRYRAAYDFLLLRSEIGEVKPSLCEWWNRLYLMSDDARADFVNALQ